MSRQFQEAYFSVLQQIAVLSDPDADFIEWDGIVWAKMRNYPGYYVSEYGDVVSIRREESRLMRPYENQYGHLYVDFCYGDKKYKMLVHRLVAMHFIPNPNNYPVVRHLDDDPKNNYYTNLAWGTQADNMQDCRDHDRDYHKPVYCYELNREFRSCADAARFFNVARSLITLACQGKVHTIAGHFHLCFADEKEQKLKDPDRNFFTYSSNKPVKATNLSTGETIIFESRKQASEVLNVHNTNITNVIAGRLPHAGGWFFENYEGR